jgi:hypothetical protein
VRERIGLGFVWRVQSANTSSTGFFGKIDSGGVGAGGRGDTRPGRRGGVLP